MNGIRKKNSAAKTGGSLTPRGIDALLQRLKSLFTFAPALAPVPLFVKIKD